MGSRSTRSSCRKTAVAMMLSGLFFASTTGCSNLADDAPELIEAYGTVTADGAPLINARVVFVSADGSPAGVTDTNGKYVIAYNDKQNGAFPGPTTVVVKVMGANEFVNDPDADDEDNDADFDRQEMEQTNVGAEWQIKIDVAEGGGPFDFDLKSEDAGKF